MSTYRELLAKESPVMQTRVAKRVEEASLKIALSMLQGDELNVSQTELAAIMGEKQPKRSRS